MMPHSIEEIVDFDNLGKEQFFSHHLNFQFRLFKVDTRYLYIFMNFHDLNVYVSTSDNRLEKEETLFLLNEFKNFDFILTNANTLYANKISVPVEVKIVNDTGYYDKVLVSQ